MRAERFRQIRNLFDAALERDPEARNVFLKEACRGDEDLLFEVGRLLAAHGEQTAWIDESILGQPLPRLEGRSFGAYEVLRQLGEGGMGAVYLAARADVESRELVALKIVRPEAATEEVLRRFKQERTILASLDHPNIARILDAGATEAGVPYLVMEYVEGEPIDSYCDRRHLDLTERLKLFRNICSAVQYAHEHHVIHRDLKPNNILVTADGVVKLLDFGIAKLSASTPDGLTCLTRSDLLLMTPEYASPEQVVGEPATPVTDVYSLGVVLYELLTGQRPYRLRSRIFREIARVICEETPTRPSIAITQRRVEGKTISVETISRARATSPAELQRRLEGDIDTILLKALEKQPLSRYRSVAHFSEDVRLHLEGLAIEARRHAFLKAATQLMVQYRWWFIVAVALGLAIHGGIVVVTPKVLWALLPMVFLAIMLLAKFLELVAVEGTSSAYRTVLGTAKVIVVIFLVVQALYALAPQLQSNSFTNILFLSAATFSSFDVFRWFRRNGRLGQTVLDLSPQGTSKLGMIWLQIIAMLFMLAAWRGSSWQMKYFPPVLFFPLLAVRNYVVHERNEIHQRGLALRGSVIPWGDVQSYFWEPDPGESEVLRVHVKGFWGMRGVLPLTIHVSPADRAAVDSIFEQQLFQWPS